jgi:hypothetical protein
MRPENKDRTFLLIGRTLLDIFDKIESKYYVLTSTIQKTCDDPQVWEMECKDGMKLYARFNNGELICKVFSTGETICKGKPVDKSRILINKLPFYLELYSKHEIYFI